MSIFAGYASAGDGQCHDLLKAGRAVDGLARRADSQRHLRETNEQLLGTLDQADVSRPLPTPAGRRRLLNLSIYR